MKVYYSHYIKIIPFLSVVWTLTCIAHPKIVYINENEGIERLNRSIKIDFVNLISNFEPERNRIFCGPATATIILNTIRALKNHKDMPVDETELSKQDRKYIPKGFSPILPRYTQKTIFKNKIKSKAIVLGQKGSDYGFTLRQLGETLKSHGLQVKIVPISSKLRKSKIRKQIISNLATKDDYVVVNYTRKTIGQKGGGHFSPLGAYDKKSDSVLIMDTTSQKYPFSWVPLNDLMDSMDTPDADERRGYLLIKEGDLAFLSSSFLSIA